MAGREAFVQDAVQRVLTTSERLGGIIVFIVDMYVVMFHGVAHVFRQKIVVNERFGRFRGKLHHHAGRRVGIHVGILTSDVVGLNVHNIQEHVTRLSLAGNGTLVAILDISLGHILSRTAHQLYFHSVLNSLDSHLRLSFIYNVLEIFSIKFSSSPFSVCNIALRMAAMIFCSLKPTMRPSRFTTVCIIFYALVKDRKSTRLNSSHANISYAVFCLKKLTRVLPSRRALVRHTLPLVPFVS